MNAGPVLGKSRTTAEEPTASSESFISESRSAAAQPLDHDAHGSAMAEGEARTVHLADEGAATADFCHEGGFAEAHFPDALAEIRITRQFPYTAKIASRQLTEWDEGVGGAFGHRVIL
jgi:hypothetical protein